MKGNLRMNLIVLTLICAAASWAVAPDLEWTRTYGGNRFDEAECVRQTSDGGYILGGSSATFGVAFTEDFWVVRTNSNGDSVWSYVQGGNRVDRCYAVIETSDGGFACLGYTESSGAGLADIWLIKLDASGAYQWDHLYGGSGIDIGYGLVETPDHGFAIVGRSTTYSNGDADFVFVRTDSVGDVQWIKNYGGALFDLAWSVILTSDGGFALAGRTQSFGSGGEDFWLVKTNAVGDSLWSKTYGGTALDRAYAVTECADGGFALGGHTFSGGAGLSDFWLVRTNSTGDSLWSKTIGTTSSDPGYFMRETAEGGFVLAGVSFGGGAAADVWVAKLSASGDSLWTKRVGGASNDAAYWIEQTSDGGFILGGGTTSSGAGNSDFYLVKLGAEVFDPTNVVVQWFGGNDLRLAWNNDGNQYYKIYSDTNPAGTFAIFVTSTTDTAIVLPGAASAAKNFYIVKGSTTP